MLWSFFWARCLGKSNLWQENHFNCQFFSQLQDFGQREPNLQFLPGFSRSPACFPISEAKTNQELLVPAKTNSWNHSEMTASQSFRNICKLGGSSNGKHTHTTERMRHWQTQWSNWLSDLKCLFWFHDIFTQDLFSQATGGYQNQEADHTKGGAPPPEYATRQQQYIVQTAMPNQWQSEICGCFDNCGICVVAFLVPCYTFGKSLEIQRMKEALRFFGKVPRV